MNDSATITEIEKDEAAEVAPAMNPTAEPHGGTHVLEAKRAAERIAQCGLEWRSRAHEADSRRRRAVWKASTPTVPPMAAMRISEAHATGGTQRWTGLLK